MFNNLIVFDAGLEYKEDVSGVLIGGYNVLQLKCCFLVEVLTLKTHLEDSTVLKPPASSASFPNLLLCFRGSCRPSAMGQVTSVCVCVYPCVTVQCLPWRWRTILRTGMQTLQLCYEDEV